MGKLSKSIKKHIKQNKIEDLESSFIGEKLYDEIKKITGQDIFSEQCKKIIEDYEFDCKKTNAKNINKISEYYDKNFKNGINQFKKKVKSDINELNSFLTQLRSIGTNLKKCLKGRIKYKYLCIEFNNRDKNHDHPIIKGILYYKKLEQFLFELEEEISQEKEIKENQIKINREKRRIEEEKRRIEEEKCRIEEEKCRIKEDIDFEFYHKAKISVDNVIRQNRKDDALSSEEWKEVIRKVKKYI